MALDPATVTKIENRWGAVYIAQLTNREDYEASSTTNTDVLEVAVNFAKDFVKERIGPAEATEDNNRVIAIVPYFLLPPGSAQRSEILEEWNDVYGKLTLRSSLPATTAQPVGSEYSRRVFTQDDYYVDVRAGFQRGYRPARGSY